MTNDKKLLETMGAPAEDAGSGEEGDYGVVFITAGKHKGKLAYYDNDEGSKAVIYLGPPFAGPYYMVSHKSLRAPTAAELQQWQQQVMNDVNVRRTWNDNLK